MADDDSLSIASSEFSPLVNLPPGRLRDIAEKLDSKDVTVVNLDAIIPSGENGVLILQHMLLKIKSSVKVLSLRFNNMHANGKEFLIDWIRSNGSLETLYVMGSGFDDSSRKKLEEAWSKNLSSHRTDNMGFTFIRIYIDPNAPPDEDD